MEVICVAAGIRVPTPIEAWKTTPGRAEHCAARSEIQTPFTAAHVAVEDVG
jgi:hypothetical protein